MITLLLLALSLFTLTAIIVYNGINDNPCSDKNLEDHFFSLTEKYSHQQFEQVKPQLKIAQGCK